MGQEKANTISYSIGGRDARFYLNYTNNFDVANLTIIGTPNAGSLFVASNFFNTIIPAVLHLTGNAVTVH